MRHSPRSVLRSLLAPNPRSSFVEEFAWARDRPNDRPRVEDCNAVVGQRPRPSVRPSKISCSLTPAPPAATAAARAALRRTIIHKGRLPPLIRFSHTVSRLLVHKIVQTFNPLPFSADADDLYGHPRASYDSGQQTGQLSKLPMMVMTTATLTLTPNRTLMS